MWVGGMEARGIACIGSMARTWVLCLPFFVYTCMFYVMVCVQVVDGTLFKPHKFPISASSPRLNIYRRNETMQQLKKPTETSNLEIQITLSAMF